MRQVSNAANYGMHELFFLLLSLRACRPTDRRTCIAMHCSMFQYEQHIHQVWAAGLPENEVILDHSDCFFGMPGRNVLAATAKHHVSGCFEDYMTSHRNWLSTTVRAAATFQSPPLHTDTVEAVSTAENVNARVH